MLNIDRLRYHLDKPFLDLMSSTKKKISSDSKIIWCKGRTRYLKHENAIKTRKIIIS